MAVASTRIVVFLAATSAACGILGAQSGDKPMRESVDYISLSDGKTLSIGTPPLPSPERPQTVKVRAVVWPKGAAFYLGRFLWEAPLGTLDYRPGASYYALVKVTERRIFVFCLWNGRHCTINSETGQLINEGVGDDALLRYGELLPLKVVVWGPQTGRRMTGEELEELKKREAGSKGGR